MTNSEEGIERPVPRRLIAAHEIAVATRDFSKARSLAGLSSQERIAQSSAPVAFFELVETQGAEVGDAEAVLGLFADTPEIPNATLARIEMHGVWSGADAFERELLGMLFDTNYRQAIEWIDRESEDAKRTITVPAGFTNEQNFVALRRNRRLVKASHLDGATAKRRHIEVDKTSTFALDIAKLSELSDLAASEVRLIVAATMFRAIDWDALHRADFVMPNTDLEASMGLLDDMRRKGDNLGDDTLSTALEDLYNLRSAMRRNRISFDEVTYRALELKDFTRLRDARSIAFIENALYEHSDLLTPAATIYYVHEASNPALESTD